MTVCMRGCVIVCLVRDGPLACGDVCVGVLVVECDRCVSDWG